MAGAEFRAAVCDDAVRAEVLDDERPAAVFSLWDRLYCRVEFPDVGFRGEAYEVSAGVDSENNGFGGSRYWSLFRKREGIGGSFERTPSFCNSLILTSSFLIWRSSNTHAFSLSRIFSSCSTWLRSKFCNIVLL